MKNKVFIFLFILFFLFPIFSTHAASSGPNSPATASGDSWSNVGNIFSSDDDKATDTIFNGLTTNYLVATNFGFNIPDGATIDGILVEYRRSVSYGGNAIDSAVRIVKGGVVGSTDKSSIDAWTEADAQEGRGGAAIYHSYGGSSDLWGETWTAAEISASTFGVALKVLSTESIGSVTVNVNHVRITVYYTEAAASSSSSSRKISSQPSYTTKFSLSGDSTFISETIDSSKPIEYVNNYSQSQTSSPKALFTPSVPATPAPTALDTAPTASNPQEQEIINQLWNLYLELKRQVEELVARH